VGSIPPAHHSGPTTTTDPLDGYEWCDPFKILANSISFKLKVKSRLKVHAERFARPEGPRHVKGSVGSDPSLAEDDLIYPPRRNVDGVGESIPAEVEWLEELLKQNLQPGEWGP
jgi:hypothetical protein